MEKRRTSGTRCSIAPVAAVLVAMLDLSACSSVPSPPAAVLVPVDVSARSTIPSARVSWYPEGPDGPEPGALTFGVEMEYTRATGRSDQSVHANEFISLGGNNLAGPLEVRHHADLRYGHVGVSGIKRFSRKLAPLELEWVAGFGQAQLDLRSEGLAPGAGTIAASYDFAGVTLGGGPRWHVTRSLAIEGRLQVLTFRPFAEDEFWYSEAALRYRPISNAAIRAGYSELRYDPVKVGADSPIHIRMRGPFVGLNLFF